jgi:hypothetical protein
MDDPEGPDARTNSPDNPGSWGAAGDLDRRDPDAIDKLNGATGGGQSGGGPYPNPHTGKEGGANEGWMGHGGQSEMPYHGEGRLGEDKVGGNANAPAEKTKAGERRDY